MQRAVTAHVASLERPFQTAADTPPRQDPFSNSCIVSGEGTPSLLQIPVRQHMS